MNINSKEYWDERFDTNWLDYAGDKQTLFFAELLCGMLPQSLVNEIREKEYSVCDMGCALGEAVPVFCRKFAVDVDGMDFSDFLLTAAASCRCHSHYTQNPGKNQIPSIHSFYPPSVLSMVSFYLTVGNRILLVSSS